MTHYRLQTPHQISEFGSGNNYPGASGGGKTVGVRTFRRGGRGASTRGHGPRQPYQFEFQPRRNIRGHQGWGTGTNRMHHHMGPTGGGGRGGRPFGGPRSSYQKIHQNKYQHHNNSSASTKPEESPWMTSELLKLIGEKEEMWNIYSQQRTEDSHRDFKIKRFEVNQAVNDAKILYYQKNPDQGQYSPYVKPERSAIASKFYCGPCDKEFISQGTLDEHTDEHITCKLDGCQYTAHAKLVMKHIEIQHSTNLFNRIKGYETPEEIEKWKQERKKNFPTPSNLERKQAEKAERKSRGEVIDISRPFKRMEELRHKILPERHKPKFFRRGPEFQSDDEQNFVNLNNLYDPNTKRFMAFNTLNQSPVIKLLHFYTDIELNTQGAVSGSTRETWTWNGDVEDNNLKNFDKDDDTGKCEFNITDDEDDTFCDQVGQSLANDKSEANLIGEKIVSGTVSETTNTNIQSYSALVGLGNYDSDSEDDVLSPEDGEICSDHESVKPPNLSKATDSNHPISTAFKACNNNPTTLSDDEEGPEELPVIKKSKLELEEDLMHNHAKIPHPVVQVEQKHPRKPKRNRHSRKTKGETNRVVHTVYKYGERARKVHQKYSLLQRLLAPDIRKERNVVLQVCRFIVDKNFFETIPAANSKTEIETKPQEPNPSIAVSEIVTSDIDVIMRNDPNEIPLIDDDNS